MEDDVLLKFGDHLRDLRKGRGLSQEQLSFKSNLHRNYICDVERGARNISLKAMEKLAIGLNISLKELMDF